MDTILKGAGPKALTWFLGTIVLALATAALTTSSGVNEIAQWVHRSFGVSFLVLFSSLVLFALYCWLRLQRVGDEERRRRIWLETGMHAANGVATLGLTYTLLGISLGIAALSQHQLTPDTVQQVIGQLTRYFSMAFLTSVVGVPVAAGLRAIILITEARITAGSFQRTQQEERQS